MQIEAAIFDRDGVLTFFDAPKATAYFQPLLPISLDALARQWQAWGAVRGFPTTLDDEETFFCDFWNHISDELALSADIRDELHAVDYTDFMVPYPEVRESLSALRAMGTKIGVLSNFTLASLDVSLARTGLEELVDVAISAQVIGSSKPDAAAYIAALEGLDVDPERTIFFDDERDCVEGGRAVGIDSFLVDRQLVEHDIDRKVVCDISVIPALMRDMRASGTR